MSEAAHCHRTGKVLFEAAPEAAPAHNEHGCTPLHKAAHKGHTDTVQCLLGLASQAAALRDADQRTQLQHALLTLRQLHEEHMPVEYMLEHAIAAAHALLRFGPAADVLAALQAAGAAALPLFANYVSTRLRA